MSKRRYITVDGVLRVPMLRRKAGAPFVARLFLTRERDEGEEVVSWSWSAFVVPRRAPGATGSAFMRWLWHYGVDNEICGEDSAILLADAPRGTDPFAHAAAVAIDSIRKYREDRRLAFTVTEWGWDIVSKADRARS